MITKEQTATGKELAIAHWSYIEALLEAHNTNENDIKAIGFHYKSALLHGFKHGIEEVGDNGSCLMMDGDGTVRMIEQVRI